MFYTGRASGSPSIKVDSAPYYALKKADGTTAERLKPGVSTVVYYNGNFYLSSGKGGEYGTAAAGDVLTGKTFGTENGLSNGTMPNNGAVDASLTTQSQEYAVPAGYHNGAGKVKANITNLAAANVKAGASVGGVAGSYSQITGGTAMTAAQLLAGYQGFVNGGAEIAGSMVNRGAPAITPGTTDQAIPAGYYSGGTVQSLAAAGALKYGFYSLPDSSVQATPHAKSVTLGVNPIYVVLKAALEIRLSGDSVMYMPPNASEMSLEFSVGGDFGSVTRRVVLCRYPGSASNNIYCAVSISVGSGVLTFTFGEYTGYVVSVKNATITYFY
jgi:hypothetical protein